jgi:hypothetical protein
VLTDQKKQSQSQAAECSKLREICIASQPPKVAQLNCIPSEPPLLAVSIEASTSGRTSNRIDRKDSF